MQLSSDDLPMFFDDTHGKLATRLRAAGDALEAIERASGNDAAIVGALANAGLF